ncbi:MAG: ATP-binding cassette domain-containing protein, partial [Pseudomonadota bacterium]
MKRPVVIAFGLSALVNLLMLTSSIYMLQVYDRVLPSRSVETLMGLFVIVGLLFGFLFLFDMLRKRLMSRMAMQFDTDLSVSAFETAMGTQSRPGGDTPGRRAQPVLALNTVRGFLTGPCVIALLDLPFMPIFLVLLFIVHPLLGWITLAGAGVAVLLAFGNWAMTRRATQINGALDGQEAVLRDRALAGTEALQAMGIGPAITQRWHAKRQQALAAGQLGTDLSDTFATASKSFRMFLQSAILSVAALLVIREEISAGMIIASSILSGRALGPIDQLIGQWRGLGRAWQSHKTLSQVLRGTGACDRSASKLPIDAQIDVVRVTKYASGAGSSAARPLLSAIEFSISGGDAVCLLGESGSGKSLLMRVLVDGVVPDAGDIRFGGVTRAQMTPDQIGRKIGYLPQDIAVVPGTVAEFISRLQADGEDDKVVQAATQAGVHRAILALPDGYDTQIGGASDVFLSAGQMQLLGLARAIYGHPKFVILDDPEPRLDS